jgi:hypothetical protein
MEQKKKDKDISIPIIFKESKDLFIGKGLLKCSKNLLKFTNQKPSQQKSEKTTVSSKYAIKEFTMVCVDKKKNLIYRGREAPQDSNYVLMKYNPDNRSIQMCPANKWINFIQSMKYSDEDIAEKEEKKAKEIKEKKAKMKEFFNFDVIDEMRQDKNPKKNKRKKKGLLDNNKEEELDEDIDDNTNKKKNKKNIYDFEEDSHSSEIEQYLEDNSENDELERIREEKEEKRKEELRKKEEEKKKEKEKDDFDDEDDKSFEDAASEVNENEDDSIFTDYLNKKRKREGYPDEKMKEEFENLLRQKGKMTYDEIIVELMKKFKKETVEQCIEKLIDENAKEFHEGRETYYFLLKK